MKPVGRLVVVIVKGHRVVGIDLVTRWKMLAELPQDPWNNDYKLVVETQTKWKVVSYGPDGSEGGGDDISSVKEEEN